MLPAAPRPPRAHPPRPSAASVSSAPSAVCQSALSLPPRAPRSFALSRLSRPSPGLPAPLSLCKPFPVRLSLRVAPLPASPGVSVYAHPPSHLCLSLTHAPLPNLGRGKVGGVEKAPAGNRGAHTSCCPTEGRTAAQHREPPEQASSFRPGCPLPQATSPLWTTGGVTPPPACDLGPLQSRWALERAVSGLPPAALKVNSGHPRHPEHAPSGDIALGAGPSMAPAMGTHHPEMVTATKATSRGSQARGPSTCFTCAPLTCLLSPYMGTCHGGSSPQT